VQTAVPMLMYNRMIGINVSALIKGNNFILLASWTRLSTPINFREKCCPKKKRGRGVSLRYICPKAEICNYGAIPKPKATRSNYFLTHHYQLHLLLRYICPFSLLHKESYCTGLGIAGAIRMSHPRIAFILQGLGKTTDEQAEPHITPWHAL